MTTARGTWMVIAHQAGARLMERTREEGGSFKLRMIRELANPDGRKKNGELDSDRSGDSFTGTRGSTGRRAMGHEQTSHDRVIQNFARSIAHELSSARMQNEFDQLILVAEPKFLGTLEGVLDQQTQRLVIGTVRKDLASVPEHQLLEHVAKALSV